MPRISKEYSIKWIDQSCIEPNNLSDTQKSFLNNLNRKLLNVENIIKSKVIKLTEIGNFRVSDPNDWDDDYEIDCYINFILDKHNPSYKEDDDNILVQLWECSKHHNWHWGIGDNNNHNEFEHWEHPMRKEYHCWLYHCLYDHTNLGWSNILRIGSIWININIEYQKTIKSIK